MTRRTRHALALCALLAPALAAAHGPVARTAEGQATEARLFTSDSATGEVVAIDLPGGNVIARLATPPHVLSFGLDAAGRHVYAMRGRNTDRDTISVIDTGFDDTGLARFPTVVRTFTGRAPGGVRDGRLSAVGGRDAIFHEAAGELEILGAGELASLGAVPTTRLKLAAPDHYHYLEAGDSLYVGHLAKGFVQVLDRASGAETARIGPCPVLHGMAKDEASGRLFFACMRDVLVIGTRGAEASREVARIPYPSTQRIAFFLHGADGVLWGKSEGAIPALLRLDPAQQPYGLEAVPVDASIQQGTTPDGARLLVYSRNGTLDLRDGRTGRLQRQLTISKPFDTEYHEHVDKALLPDIVATAERAWITIPPEGVIVEVDLVAGKETRRIAVGGQPTRLVLATPPAPAATR